MRIIGGQFKGYRFSPPADKWPTRPTTDFSKEALYNILLNVLDFETTNFLDLFGGSGNHCYECISRGALTATYVDKFGNCIKFVRKMAEKLDIEDQITIVRMDVFKYIQNCNKQYQYIFAGPPYGLPTIHTIPDKIFQNNLLTDDGLLVVEHNPFVSYNHHPRLTQVRNYGQTHFSFFRPEQKSTVGEEE